MADETPSLITIPNVPIVSTGTYQLMTGETTFTAEDLAAAVAAQDDPAVQSPRLKIGHTTKFGDGEPCFGKVLNMRLDATGQTIIGDYVDVPAWLAEIMPVAYPSRSIEGIRNAETSTGKEHALLIEAVSLLGVVAPGVSVLDDLTNLYGSEMPEGTEVVASGERVCASVGEDRMPTRVHAAVEVEDVRRSYYEQLSGEQMWWWIRAIRLDPQDLIVDDDEGGLYRVPFEVGSDGVSFGDPVPVEIVYVDAESDKTQAARIAAGSGRVVASFNERSESRPETKETTMEPNEVRQLLGLPEDASDDDVRAKLAERAEAPQEVPSPAESEPGAEESEESEAPAEETPEESEPSSEPTPEEAEQPVTVDAATWREVKASAERGEAAHRQLADEKRERILTDAVKAGKFPPSRVEHYRAAYNADPEGTEQLIASLAEGLVPVHEEGGAPGESASEAAYPVEWLPEVAARAAGTNGGSRVIQEA